MKTLIDEYLEGSLNDSQRTELFDALEKNGELQQYLLNQMRMHQTLGALNEDDNEKLISSIGRALDDDGASLTAQVMGKLQETRRFEQRRFRRRTTYVLFACAAAILFGFIIIFSNSLQKTGGEEAVNLNKNGQPVVNVNKDLKGQNKKKTFKIAKSLASTEYKELITPSGVRLILQGPARYALIEDNKLRLDRGRLLASVPPKAVGFTVSTPDGKIKDLSTEFGVKVGAEGTGVHVLKGSVEAGLHGSEAIVLKEGTALRLNKGNEEFKPLYFDGSSFAKTIPKGQVVSVNFGGHAGVVGRTGIVPAENWNNVLNSTTKQYLLDDAGQLLNTYVDVNWTGIQGTAEVSEVKTEMQRLFKGRINHTHNSSNKEKPIDPMVIKVNGVEFKKYDLYVFYWIGRRFDDHCFDLQVNGGKKYRIHRPTMNSLDSEDEFILWQGVGRNKSGNTQVFKNLTGKDIEIKSILPLGDFDIHRSWFICGLQIVERD
jgi:hypothetical protein